jgi:ferredoxin
MAVERTDAAARQRSRRLRWVVLGIVLAAMTALTTAHQHWTSWRPAGVDALCPFGGVESLYSLLAGDGFVRRVAAGSLILLVGAVFITLLYRRSFCGQICPLGALQGVFGALGRRLFGLRRPQAPRALDGAARWLKYVVLAVFAFWTWQAAELVMRPYDPWAAWAHLTSDELLASFGIGFAVLVVSLAGSLLYDRFFCKYLCPMGAFLGLFSKVSLLGVRRDAVTCTDCGACDRACFMNIEVSRLETVTASECVACNECVNACPVRGALEVKTAGGRTFGPALVTGLVVLAMAALIGVTTATGSFAWDKQPGGGQGRGSGDGQGQGEGQDPGGGLTIRGYTTMLEISAATGIPPEDFTERWGVPEPELGLPLSDLKDRYGFLPHEVAAWVEERVAP